MISDQLLAQAYPCNRHSCLLVAVQIADLVEGGRGASAQPRVVVPSTTLVINADSLADCVAASRARTPGTGRSNSRRGNRRLPVSVTIGDCVCARRCVYCRHHSLVVSSSALEVRLYRCATPDGERCTVACTCCTRPDSGSQNARLPRSVGVRQVEQTVCARLDCTGVPSTVASPVTLHSISGSAWSALTVRACSGHLSSDLQWVHAILRVTIAVANVVTARASDGGDRSWIPPASALVVRFDPLVRSERGSATCRHPANVCGEYIRLRVAVIIGDAVPLRTA